MLRDVGWVGTALLVLSGCIAEPSSLVLQVLDEDLITTLSVVEFQGRTATIACAVTPVTPVCHYGEEGKAEHVELGFNGSVHLYGNLTWVAASPATRELLVEIVLDDNVEDGSPLVVGESPLAVDFDLSMYPKRNVAIGISALRCTCPNDAGAEHSLPQEFAFRGVYMSVGSDPSAS